MDLGLQLGYWGQLPPADWVERSVEADHLGYTSVWAAEAWGSDAFSPLAYLAAVTDNVQLGTSVAQLAARTPTQPSARPAAYEAGRSRPSLSTDRLITWKVVCTSRTCSTSSIQREVIQAHGHIGSNQKSTRVVMRPR